MLKLRGKFKHLSGKNYKQQQRVVFYQYYIQRVKWSGCIDGHLNYQEMWVGQISGGKVGRER